MPLAPAIAAALTTGGAHPWGLFVDGLDVVAEPAATKRYGVVWPSIDLSIAAPGGASSMAWDVDDTSQLLTFVEGQDVRFVRLGQGTSFPGVTDAAWFLGTLEVATSTALGTGRQWHLKATGVDAIPDWTVTDYALAFPTFQEAATMVQAVIAACGNRGPIVALEDPVLNQGLLPLTIGNLGGAGNIGPGGAIPIAIPAGTTMRRAVEIVLAACAFDLELGARFTIDHYGQARLYQVLSPLATPDGDVSIPLTPLGGAGLAPADDTYTRDGTTVVRQAIVNGAGGVRGFASDGSGRRGRTAVVTDNTLTTVDQCQAAAQAYLANHTTAIRGTVAQEAIPGGSEALAVLYKLDLTDNPVGSTGVYEVGGMQVTFDAAGRPTIVFTYGGRAPSLGDLVRRMAGSPLQS